jgi:transposase-like protein
VTTGEAEEIARLHKQLREVTEERDILARVTASVVPLAAAADSEDRRVPFLEEPTATACIKRAS